VPVCGLVSCGAALDAGTLSGLCGGCRGVRYCGGDCQRAGWPAHRAACHAATAARKAAAAAAVSSDPTPGATPTAALLEQRAEVETWRRMPLDALQQAAEAGVAAAQAALGRALVSGSHGVVKDEAAALAWMRKAAAGGLLPMRGHLASVTRRAALAAGPAAAAMLLEDAVDCARPAAEAGDAESQYTMFRCCIKLADAGGGGPAAAVHWAEAARWLRLALAQGETDAMEMMACIVWDGDALLGFARDRAEARRLFAASDAAGAADDVRAARPAGAPGSAQSPL
jgi:TPR repeat protein